MSATAFIRKFVFNLPEGKIFTTRDCLQYGFRAAIDEALYRLVKTGVIRRLCRGVFVRDSTEQMVFSDYEIAKVKAESFGRLIREHANTLAAEMGLRTKASVEVKFAVNSRSSQFQYGEKVIHLREICERKMRLEPDDDKSGRVLRALWQVGREEGQMRREVVAKALGVFKKVDYAQLRQSAKWLPAWLNDSFKYVRRWEPSIF